MTVRKRPAHRPPYDPTEKDRLTVKVMTAGGIDQATIATVIGISKPTLRKYFRQEIRISAPEANAAVVQSLFQMATKGKNIAAAIWWTKARMGWGETNRVETTGPDGRPIESGVTYRW